MAIKGLLYGKKGFLTKLFEPYGIELQGIKMLEDDADGTSYTFIWDVAPVTKLDKTTGKLKETRSVSELSKYTTVEKLLQENFPERDVQVDRPSEAKYIKFRSWGGTWRLITTVYFYTKDEEE